MNRRQFSRWCPVVALVALGAGLSAAQAVAAPPDRPAASEGIEVLTRGPVHEAFAEVIAFDRQAGVVVPKAPPDAINEVPPDQKPAGANVAWIPGYWAWDDEQSDFLWVSGLWRFLPPGRQWVAGYWGKSDDGYQWTSGYWADADARDVEYLPQPPEMVNADPDGDAPSDNQTWIPGVQVWNQNGYSVRPGYWAKMQTDWEWIPAHYVSTPRGYVFVDGYWDYAVNRRGMLFAPVSFDAGVYAQPGFSYSPFNVINTAALIGYLFVRPSYGHYYFGDYYAANYEGMGFYPPYSFHNHQGYDPFYAQQRWQNRNDGAWQQSQETEFRNRRNNEEARPPRTLAAQAKLATSGKSKNEGILVAAPLSELAKSKEHSMKLEAVSKSDKELHGQSAKALDNHRAERQKLEASTAGAKAAADGSAAAKAKLTASPIVAKSRDQLGADHAPPKIHETPPAEHKAAVKAEPKATPKAAAKLEPLDEPAKAPKAEPKVESKPTPKGDAKPAPKTDPKPAPKADSKPAPKPEPKPAAKDEPKPGPKPAAKNEPKPEPKPAAKDEPKPGPKPASKDEPKPEPKPAAKDEPKPGPKPAPKDAPKPEPKPAAKDAPKPGPKPAAKDAPKPGPKPAAKDAPKPEPKPAAKDEPKPGPKPAAKDEPKPGPKPVPKDEKKPGPKGS